jgi:fructokinase
MRRNDPEGAGLITVVGEILVDLIENAPGQAIAYPGGSPANVAVALARLGQPVSLLTQLGHDDHGRMLLGFLRDNGVALDPGSLANRPRTSSARAYLNADGQATYRFDVEWRRFALDLASWPDPSVTCVHTGSLAAVMAPGAAEVAALVHRARASALISFDPNCRPSLMRDADAARGRMIGFVAESDIVRASLDDLVWLYPRRSYQDVGREWLARGAGLVVVTLGADGAWACTRSGELAVPAAPATLVDTVGAGDAFSAGLLCALSRAGLLDVERRADLHAIDLTMLKQVLAFATRVAAATCGRRGADPPTLAELGCD